MKSIAVSGAGGLVGGSVVRALLERGDCSVIAVTGSPEAARSRFADSRLDVASNVAFASRREGVDVFVHCAFARGSSADGLAASLELTRLLVESVKARKFVYISSQGVYGTVPRGYFAREDDAPAPRDPYAAAKLEGEKIVGRLGASATSLRLASVAQNCGFLRVFASRVRAGEPITVTAPRQAVSLIDVRDAVGGILAVADAPCENLAPVYNLGTGKQYTILECAQAVRDAGRRLGFDGCEIEVADGGSEPAMGVDPALFMRYFGWSARYELDDMARDVFSRV